MEVEVCRDEMVLKSCGMGERARGVVGCHARSSCIYIYIWPTADRARSTSLVLVRLFAELITLSRVESNGIFREQKAQRDCPGGMRGSD